MSRVPAPTQRAGDFALRVLRAARLSISGGRVSGPTDAPAAAPTGAARPDTAAFQAGAVTTVMLGHGVHDTYTAFLPPLLPVLIEKFALSNTQAGLLNVFMQWPSLLQPFIGYLADRTNLRWLFILAPAVAAVCMSLLGVAPSFAVMAFLLIAVGIGSSGMHSVGTVIAGNLSGKSLGRGMGMWMVGGGLGYTVGPLILVGALGVLGLNGIPWLMTGGIAASVVLYARLRGVSSLRGEVRSVQPWRAVIATMRPVLVPVIGITIVRSFMAAALQTFLPTFMSSEGSSLWIAGAALAIFEGAGMVGSLAAGTVSDLLGRRRVLAAAMAITSPLMFLFVGVGGSWRLPVLVLLGFCAMSIMPVMLALMQENFPENRAFANGFYLGVSFLTNATASLMLGGLADAFSLRTAFLVSAAVPMLGLPLVWLLPGRRE